VTDLSKAKPVDQEVLFSFFSDNPVSNAPLQLLAQAMEAERHVSTLPGYLIALRCPADNRCAKCEKVPKEQLKISDDIRAIFHNIGPILMMKNGHFSTLFDLLSHPPNQPVPSMTEDYKEYMRCLLCPNFYCSASPIDQAPHGEAE